MQQMSVDRVDRVVLLQQQQNQDHPGMRLMDMLVLHPGIMRLVNQNERVP
jgi:hypothetical protein